MVNNSKAIQERKLKPFVFSSHFTLLISCLWILMLLVGFSGWVIYDAVLFKNKIIYYYTFRDLIILKISTACIILGWLIGQKFIILGKGVTLTGYFILAIGLAHLLSVLTIENSLLQYVIYGLLFYLIIGISVTMTNITLPKKHHNQRVQK